MKILTIDVGTGTQDIFLYDSRLDLENGFKLVLPSPTMIVRRQIQQAARQRRPVLLSGVTMGGGPSSWAVEDAIRAGLAVYATPAAARTLNDDLAAVQAAGVQVIGEDEARRLPDVTLRVELRDFDYALVCHTLESFGVPLHDLAAVAVAVFDHGAAPVDVSDRQFRFDYLAARIRAENRLSAFAYRSADIPAAMTRLQAVAQSAGDLPVPLVVMDTAPAAVLGATFDPLVAARPRQLIANVGNFHTLAFRLGPAGIEGVFEHHTGLLNTARLDALLRALADGSLTHAEVFSSSGHGALVVDSTPLPLDSAGFQVAVTGPRRAMLRNSSLRPYYAVPFGDMMIAGCFGLLSATADRLPDLKDEITASLRGAGASGTPPWENG